MTIILRDYQEELIERTRKAMALNNSVVMQLPTGGGKTLTTAWIINSARQKNRRSIFCVHRIELLWQTSAAFEKVGIPHGFIASGMDYDPKCLTHIASIETLKRRLDVVEEPDLLVVDEAGHAMSDGWQKVINYWPKAKKLLITATPERLDGRGLKHVAQELVLGKTPRWLTENGYLAPSRVFAPDGPDLTGVKTLGGDYANNQLAEAMDKSEITGSAVEHYKRICDGMSAIVFAVNIQHSKNIAAQFNEAGIAAEHLDGKCAKIARENIIERFRCGETLVLSNVNILTEGFDVPGVRAAILLRPTKSLSLFLQMIGRALRPAPNKPDAIILDHAGNSARFGLPIIEREWSLEGHKGQKKKKPEAVTGTCERCFHVWEKKPNEPVVCPACGWKPEKKEIAYVAGDLSEITEDNNPWAWAKTKSLSTVLPKVTTMRDLRYIAKARGFKPGWAYFKAKELGIRDDRIRYLKTNACCVVQGIPKRIMDT